MEVREITSFLDQGVSKIELLPESSTNLLALVKELSDRVMTELLHNEELIESLR